VGWQIWHRANGVEWEESEKGTAPSASFLRSILRGSRLAMNGTQVCRLKQVNRHHQRLFALNKTRRDYESG